MGLLAVQMYSLKELDLNSLVPFKNPYPKKEPPNTEEEIKFRDSLKELGVIFFRDSANSGSAFHILQEKPVDCFYYQFAIDTTNGQIVSIVKNNQRVHVFWLDAFCVKVEFL